VQLTAASALPALIRVATAAFAALPPNAAPFGRRVERAVHHGMVGRRVGMAGGDDARSMVPGSVRGRRYQVTARFLLRFRRGKASASGPLVRAVSDKEDWGKAAR